MSTVRFITKTRSVEIDRNEYRRIRRTATEQLLAVLKPQDFHLPNYRLKKAIPSHIRTGEEARTHIAGSLKILGYPRIDLELNTMLAIGNDAMRVAAYIYGRSHCNGYFNPRELSWLKGGVKQGLQSGFFKSGYGWEDVVTFIEYCEALEYPIVLASSIGHGFPSAELLVKKEEELISYQGYSHSQLFDLCLAKLKQEKKAIHPGVGMFGNQLNGYQFMDVVYSMPSSDKELW